MKIAIVSLAVGDYWKGAKVLFYTLKKYGGLPDWVDTVLLGAKESTFAIPAPIKEDYSWIPVCQKNFSQVAKKLAAIDLPYDRIILMDADMLCVGNCSYLWSNYIGCLPFYACRDCASVIYYPERLRQIGLDENRIFNGGTMIFQKDYLPPNFKQELLTGIRDGTLQSYDKGDQGYLNHYFQSMNPCEIGYLPQEYNGCTDRYIPQIPDHAKRIIHFTGTNANPWNSNIRRSDPRWPWIKQWKKEWLASKYENPSL